MTDRTVRRVPGCDGGCIGAQLHTYPVGTRGF